MLANRSSRCHCRFALIALRGEHRPRRAARLSEDGPQPPSLRMVSRLPSQSTAAGEQR